MIQRTFSFAVFCTIVCCSCFTIGAVSADSDFKRGTWTDTVKDLVAATQDDPHYRRIVLQELLASSSSSQDGNSFADTVCSHPEILRCIGNPNDSKGSATSESWPVEITINKFNGTVNWDKLPKATVSLRIVQSPVAVVTESDDAGDGEATSERNQKKTKKKKQKRRATVGTIDLTDLMKRLPNSLETLQFVKTRLTLSESSPQQSRKRRGAGGKNKNNNNEDGDNNDDTSDNSNKKNSNNNNKGGAKSSLVGDLQSLNSVLLEQSELDPSVVENMWLPVVALRKFEMIGCRFKSVSIAPMLILATELEEVRVISNQAPIRFRELLVELVARSSLKTIDFQALVQSPGDELLPDMSFPRSLERLRLSNLSLHEIPKALPPNLKTLAMPLNRLKGKCPDLSDTVLEEVDFANNSISEFPFKLPASVRRFKLPSNKLRGSLDLTNLPRQLVELSVAHNELSGNVDLTKLPPRLEVLDIAYNQFSGPVNMREFPDSVRYVFLQNNGFTGRYDVSRLPLMSVRVLFGGNKWDSLLPRS